MAGMQNNSRPFSQYDDNISPTQEDNHGAPDDRPVPDNGTRDADFSCGGMRTCPTVSYPLPQDPNSPEGKDYSDNNGAEISDFGLNERTEVGFNGGIHAYGLVGSEASVSSPQNPTGTGDSGIGFGGSAGGGKDENITQ